MQAYKELTCWRERDQVDVERMYGRREGYGPVVLGGLTDSFKLGAIVMVRKTFTNGLMTD